MPLPDANPGGRYRRVQSTSRINEEDAHSLDLALCFHARRDERQIFDGGAENSENLEKNRPAEDLVLHPSG
jgi:hypothetical protein